MITSFNDLTGSLGSENPVSIAIAQPKHKALLSAIEKAQSNGWIEPIIIADKDDAVAAYNTVQVVRNGQASVLMKGDLTTSILLKAVLSPDGIRTENRLSHIAVVEAREYNRLTLWTDGGVNINLNIEIMGQIISNACKMAHALGIYHPNIACLALVEKIQDNLPETYLAAEMVKHYKNDEEYAIEGPMAVDVALSEWAAQQKRISSNIAGKTDIFIGSSITATNHIVKTLLSVGGAKGGGIILGAQGPIVLLSRSDDAETKLLSIALGVLASRGE